MPPITADLTKGTGAVLTYQGNTGTLTPPDGAKNKLVKNGDSSFTETQQDGFVIQYGSNGKPSYVKNAAGDRWTLAYDSGGRSLGSS